MPACPHRQSCDRRRSHASTRAVLIGDSGGSTRQRQEMWGRYCVVSLVKVHVPSTHIAPPPTCSPRSSSVFRRSALQRAICHTIFIADGSPQRGPPVSVALTNGRF